MNQITGRFGATPVYDANGNLTDNGLTFKAVYDFRNRLVEVKRQDNTLQAAYSYDGLNRRIRKITYGTDGTTVLSDVRYIHDGSWRVIEERDHADSDRLVARYVYGTQYIDEPLRMYRDTNGDEQFADLNENFYYLQDRLFNVVALTDTDGAVQERVVYEPYGRSTCRRSDGDETVGSHFGNPYLFTGRELDSETCFYNYRNRYYSAALGRFLNEDPVEDGVNLYEYVGNAPTTATDPNGLCASGAMGWVHDPGFTVDGPLSIFTIDPNFYQYIPGSWIDPSFNVYPPIFTDWDPSACPLTCRDQLGFTFDLDILKHGAETQGWRRKCGRCFQQRLRWHGL